MRTAESDSLGHIILPEEIRERHHLTPDTKFQVEEKAGQIILKPISSNAIDQAIGFLGDCDDINDFLLKERKADSDREEHGLSL